MCLTHHQVYNSCRTIAHIKKGSHYAIPKDIMKKFSVVFVGLMMKYTFNVDVFFEHENFLSTFSQLTTKPLSFMPTGRCMATILLWSQSQMLSGIIYEVSNSVKLSCYHDYATCCSCARGKHLECTELYVCEHT